MNNQTGGRRDEYKEGQRESTVPPQKKKIQVSGEGGEGSHRSTSSRACLGCFGSGGKGLFCQRGIFCGRGLFGEQFEQEGKALWVGGNKRKNIGRTHFKGGEDFFALDRR